MVKCERCDDPWLKEVQEEIRHGRMTELTHRFLHGQRTNKPGSWCQGKPSCGNSKCAQLACEENPDAKADVEAVIKLCGLDPSKVQLKRSVSNCYHSGRSGVFSLGKNEIAQFGEIHPIILENFNLKLNVVGFEINIQNIP